MEHWIKIKIIAISIGLGMFTVTCSDKKVQADEETGMKVEHVKSIESEGYNLMKAQCYICHNPESPSHDSIIAPPLAAVKMRYQMQYKTEEEFVDALVAWTMDPQESKALMRGAVEKFNAMPKQLFKEEEIKKMATYIYNNKLEEPEWFNVHQKEMHADGKMGGMGNMPK